MATPGPQASRTKNTNHPSMRPRRRPRAAERGTLTWTKSTQVLAPSAAPGGRTRQDMCTTPSLPVLAVTLLSIIMLVGCAGRLFSASHAHAPGPFFFLALVRPEHPPHPPGEVDDMPRAFKHAAGARFGVCISYPIVESFINHI
jgi:hypothetical protein